MNVFANPLLAAVNDLLAKADLPASDLDQGKLANFFGCESDNDLIGLVGLELFDSVALLRSLAVDVSRQDGGLGRLLVDRAEDHAKSRGVRRIFLLTTTAESFFEHLAYRKVPRENAPVEIRATEQFSDLCPAESALMMKCF